MRRGITFNVEITSDFLSTGNLCLNVSLKTKHSENVDRCKRCRLSLTCEKSLCENGPDVDLGASNR